MLVKLTYKQINVRKSQICFKKNMINKQTEKIEKMKKRKKEKIEQDKSKEQKILEKRKETH